MFTKVGGGVWGNPLSVAVLPVTSKGQGFCSDLKDINTKQKFWVTPLVPISDLSRPNLPERTVLHINLNAVV